MELKELKPATDDAPATYQLDAYLMRSNSAVSDHSWLAEITGTHPKFKLAREFVPRQKFEGGSWNGRQIFGPLYRGRIYEYRAIAEDEVSGYAYMRGHHLSGFFEIDEDGCFSDLELPEVMLRAAEMQASRTVA